MQQAIDSVVVSTQGAGLYEVSPALRSFVAGAGISTGLVTAYVRHTSCSLLIQEKYLDLVKTLRGQAKVEVADPELKKIVEQAEQGAQPAQPEQTPEQAPEGAQ